MERRKSRRVLVIFQSVKKIVRNPIYGVNPLQLDKEVAENKSNVGSYVISGNKMTIDWADGKKQTINIEFKIMI